MIANRFGSKEFYGIGNFHLATIGEPLNRLMKKEQPFVWGKEQDAAFVKANASTLAYFDVNAGYRGC